MRRTKLTLSADRDLIRAAKSLAARHGTSLSSMFCRFLAAVLGNRRGRTRPGPLTRKATGLARMPKGKTERELLEAALSEKYGL